MMNMKMLSLGMVPLLMTQPVHQPSAQRIEKVADLRVARAAHTATTLASGDVLVVGGMAEGGGSVTSVELFDPLRNGVREVGSLAQPRSGHTATLLPDGRVIVAGGYNGEYLATVEVYEPATGRLRSAGSLQEGRSGHTATLLRDGRVLIAGGVGRGWTFLQSAELYDPTTGKSQRIGAMSAPRESHTATLLQDGRVLVIGGHTGRRATMTVYARTEIFSPATRRFEAAAPLATPRHKHDAIALADGRVLVIGGADRTDRRHFATTEVYDAGSGRFTAGPTMSNARYKIAGTSVLLRNGDVLVTSGARTAERLDLRQWRFRPVPGSLPAAFRFAAATTLRSGDVFIAGGYSDGNRNTGGVWRFQLE